MSRDPSVDAQDASAAEPDSKRRVDRASFVPTLAVLAVAIAAVAAAFMGVRPDAHEARPAAALPATPQAVVHAPPLVVTAPPLKPAKPKSEARGQGSELPDTTSAMGSAPVCEKCGVVETVLAAKPGDTFQMRIRMDDGSLRTVEQRGALAAGTRVVVEGSSVRLPG
jgi:hypothetical protein